MRGARAEVNLCARVSDVNKLFATQSTLQPNNFDCRDADRPSVKVMQDDTLNKYNRARCPLSGPQGRKRLYFEPRNQLNTDPKLELLLCDSGWCGTECCRAGDDWVTPTLAL